MGLLRSLSPVLASFCNFRGPFFKNKGVPRWIGLFGTKSPPKLSAFWDFWHRRLAAILEHYGQLKKPELELLQNLGCLSGEIMTQTKKRKAIETVRGYKSSKKVNRTNVRSVLLSVMFSNTLLKKKIVLNTWVFFCAQFDPATWILCGIFFPNCANSVRPVSRINTVREAVMDSSITSNIESLSRLLTIQMIFRIIVYHSIINSILTSLNNFRAGFRKLRRGTLPV